MRSRNWSLKKLRNIRLMVPDTSCACKVCATQEKKTTTSIFVRFPPRSFYRCYYLLPPITRNKKTLHSKVSVIIFDGIGTTKHVFIRRLTNRTTLLRCEGLPSKDCGHPAYEKNYMLGGHAVYLTAYFSRSSLLLMRVVVIF